MEQVIKLFAGIAQFRHNSGCQMSDFSQKISTKRFPRSFFSFNEAMNTLVWDELRWNLLKQVELCVTCKHESDTKCRRDLRPMQRCFGSLRDTELMCLLEINSANTVKQYYRYVDRQIGNPNINAALKWSNNQHSIRRHKSISSYRKSKLNLNFLH